TTAPAHGTLLKNGTAATSFTQDDINNNLISYQHDGGETTTDSFSFTVGDGTATSGTISFNITVTPQNDPPALTTNTGLTLNEGATAVIGQAKLGAPDPDNSPSTSPFPSTTAPAHGTLLKNGAAVTSFTQA